MAACVVLLQPFAGAHLLPDRPHAASAATEVATPAAARGAPEPVIRLVPPPRPAPIAETADLPELSVAISSTLPSGSASPSPVADAAPPVPVQPAPIPPPAIAATKAAVAAKADPPAVAALVAAVPQIAPAITTALGPPSPQREPLPLQTDLIEPDAPSPNLQDMPARDDTPGPHG